MVAVLLIHCCCALSLYTKQVILVIVLNVLHLLQVSSDERFMGALLPLHLGIKVSNLSRQILDLIARVRVEIMDHVVLNLERVALHLSVAEFLSHAQNQSF